ncbi:MAG TPA: hypothetical protein VFW91_09840 [Candidatus Binatia bacterium]|nr:hypothetical protein [Candidatus Binatia bacterium]
MKNSEFLWSFLLLAISTLVLSLPVRAAVEAALEQFRKIAADLDRASRRSDLMRTRYD